MNAKDKTIREEMQAWMHELASDYNVGITFQFNKDDIKENEARKAISVAFGTLYRKILGKKWYKKVSEQYKFIGFQEMGKSKSNRHFHFMLKLENVDFISFFKLSMYLNRGVQKVVSSAKVKVELLYDSGWGPYISKEVTSENNTLLTEKDFR